MASFRCLEATDRPSPLTLALQLVEQRLLGWAADQEAFAAVLLQAFGRQANGAAGEGLRASLLAEGLEVGLAVGSLPGLRGAYAAATGTAPEGVVLDGDWLAVATAEELEAVLLEELGHAIDQRLNGAVDSPGDEGEIFSALLRGVASSADSAAEDDQRWITLAGVPRLVEAADTTAPRVLLNGSRTPSFSGSAIAYGLPDVGDSAHPSFVDIDADGDLDVFIGNRDGKTVFFQNIGNASFPAFAGSVSAFGLIDVGVLSTPTFADIDADGDLDAFIGNQAGSTIFFRNTGNKFNPAFAGSVTSAGLTDVGSNASPSLVDIDADGDLDAFIGNASGNTLFFSNTGTKISAAFAGSSIAFGLSNTGVSAQPSFADIDADGDLDAFIGNNGGNIIFFRNTGSTTNPAFAGSSIGFGLPDVGFYASPNLVDIDADGDLDLFIGTDYGNTLMYANDGNFAVSSPTTNGIYGAGSIITIRVSFTENVFVTGSPNLLLKTGTINRTAAYNSGSGTNSLSFRYTVQPGDTSADLDTTATTSLQLNGGTIKDAAGNNAILTLPEPGTAGSLGANAALVIDGVPPVVGAEGVEPSLLPTPGGILGAGAGATITILVWFNELVSVDTSGGTPTLSLETGRTDSVATYISGSGNRRLTFQYTVANGDSSADLDYTSTTALQLNGASIRDIAGNAANLTLPAPGAAGSLGSGLFPVIVDGVAPAVALNGSRLPAFASTASSFGLTDVGDGASPAFADIDADGDLDAFIGNSIGNTVFFRNTGTPTSAAFIANSYLFGFADAGANARPTLADIDADGDLDVFIGGNHGSTLFFRNTGTAGSAAFASSSIGFGLPDVGGMAFPAFADIDADGDLDAFIGNSTGSILFFRNSGSRTSPAFAGSSIAFGLPTVGLSANPTFADIDADGDLDALIGNSSGNTFFFRNTGSRAIAAFAGSSLAFGLPKVTAQSVPTLVDIDGDGDLDAFIGETAGSTLFLRNTAIAGLSSTTANGSYGIGKAITILVPFSEDVVLDTSGGIPSLLLETGSIDRVATYNGGSGTNTLSFRYTVQAGDASVDLDLHASGVLQLNGALLSDRVGNSASLTLPAPGTAGSLGANAALVIDGVAPVVSAAGLSSTTANGTYGLGSVITILVPFTKVVTVNTSGGTPTLLLETGSVDRAASYVGGSGTNTLRFQYTVGSDDSSADLDVSSSSALQLNGGSISDALDNPATLTVPAPGSAGSLGANAALVIDALGPVVTSSGLTSSNGNGPYGVNQVITILVPFTRDVVVDTTGGVPTLQLATGSTSQVATYSGGSGTTTLRFQYTVQPGDSSADLDITSISALQLNGASIRDASGLNANLTLPAPGEAGSLAANAALVIDTVAPGLVKNGSRIPAFSGSSIGFGLPAVPFVARPCFADIDADGDFDAFIGNNEGNILFFRNTGTPTSAAFAGSSLGFGLPDIGYVASPTLADIDADGDLDLFIGDVDGWTFFFRNIGTASSATFAGSSIAFGFPRLQTANPLFADIDADTDLDAFISNGNGNILFFRNTGSRANAAFAAPSLAFDLAVAGSNPKLALADSDSDGDLDAFIGVTNGNTTFYRNTGSPSSPSLAGSSIGFGLPDVGAAAAPTLVDIDADGDLDLFIGNQDGSILFFRNTGSGGLSSASGDGLFGIGRVITIQLAFNEVVKVDTTGGLPTLVLETGSTDRTATYSGGSGTSVLRFQYTVQPGDTAADLDSASTGALQLNGATLRDLADNPASLTLPEPGSAGSLAANASVVVDGLAPAVAAAGLRSANANGSYRTGMAITVAVPFTEAVTVDTTAGTPTLLLETGSSDGIATYSGGSGTDTLLFTYTVQSGQASADLDIHSAGALGLNGATIVDAAGNAANLTLPAPGATGSLAANAALVIDAVAPTLTGSTPSDNATGISESGLIQLNFSEPVQAGSGQIALWRADGVLVESFAAADGSGSAGGSVTFNGGSVRLVQNAFASSTAYYLTIDGTAITDLAGNAYAGFSDATSLDFSTGDSIVPSITDVSSVTGDGTYAPGDTVILAIRFSEAVTAITTGGVPSLLLETGSTDREATYLSGSGSNTLTFAYTVGKGDSAMDLTYTGSDALRLNGGSLRDTAGNPANLSLPLPDAAGSLGFNAALVIDGVAPAVARYGSTTTAYAAASIGFAATDPLIQAARPAFADIDGDGDLDAFIGELYGTTLFFRNTGTQTSPAFASISSGSGLPDVGDFASPAFADIDADGDLDAFIGELSGDTFFFRNTGTAASPAFAGSSLGFGWPDVGYSAKPTFADIDADGDLDAFIGERNGNVLLFRNTGTASSAAFAGSSSGAGLPFASFSASPGLADIDGDGDLDAFIGTSDGDITSFRNSGTAVSPAFAAGSLAFDLPPGSMNANPTLVDIDGDGDVDAFIGTLQSSTLFFRNTGTVGLFSTPADGTHAAGSVITIHVPFTEDVFVESGVGSPPFLLLETGSTDRPANYLSGSGTNTLRFQYTVQPGDSSSDLDVTSTAALQLNGGRIRDAFGNDASLTLPVPGTIGSLSSTAALVIDGVVPTVTGLTTTAANGLYGSSRAITIQVQFSEVVNVQTGTTPPSLLLETGSIDRPATYSGGSGTQTLSFTYTVQPGDLSADLDVASSAALQLNTGSIRDGAGNSANLTLPTPGAPGSLGANAALVVDGVAPALASPGLTSTPINGAYGVGQGITIRVPFTEVVTVTGTPSVLLETGTTDRPATYLSGSGTNTLSFRYTVQSGDSSADLDLHSSATLQLNNGSILDAAKNMANLTLRAPGTPGSLGANSALVIDGVAPAVAAAGLTSTSANGTYGAGRVITIQVPFTEVVNVNTTGGRPTLLLETGSIDQIATYSGGSGSNTLSFQYTVQPGNSSADLDVASTTALQLNGAVISDARNNLANLTLRAPGSVGSLAANAALVIDAVGPAVAFNGARNPAFTGSSIGFGLPNVGANARPTFVDIDADGDLDAFIGGSSGNVLFFRNTGTPTTAAFTGSSVGFGLGGFNLIANPSFADIDADGDLDAFIINSDRNTLLYRNTGTAASPAFAASSIVPGLTDMLLSAHPSFVDIDADGDLDAIIGNEDGYTRLYRNTGSASSAAFAPGSIAFGFPDVRFSASPTFVDIDADEDLDAFIGNIDGSILFFRNTGSPTTASFADSSIGFGLPNAGQFIKPTFADIDGDGDLDAFVGNASGNTLFFRNTGSGSLSAITENGSYGVGTVITILVPFNEVVFVNTTAGRPTLLLETGSSDRRAVYTSGSGSRILRFQYTVQPGDTSADLDITTSSALQLNGGTILDAMGNQATLSLPAPGSPGSLAAAGALVIDGVTPAVASLGLTSTTANGTYNVGRVITIQVPFTEPVVVNTSLGTPLLVLETGAIDQGASYSGGSGTNTLSFQYTVQSGDSSADLDGISSAALQLNGSTIRDAAGNNANLLLSAPGRTGSLGANTVLVIDGVEPKLAAAGVTSVSSNGSYPTGAVIPIRVPFTEIVTVNTSGGVPTLRLETGLSDSRATYSSGSGTNSLLFTYTVQAGDASADLDYHSTTALELNGAIVRDTAGNNANLTLPEPGGPGSLAWNADIWIDALAPALTPEGLTATSLYGRHGSGSEITILVPFKEVVTVDTSGGTPTLLLETGATDRAAIYSGGSGTNTLSFRYTVVGGDSAASLDITGTTALQLNGGTIRDAAGMDAILTLPAPGGVGSLSANAALTIDGVAPEVVRQGALNPSFAASSIAYGLPTMGLRSPSPTFADIDADGDLDAFIGTGSGQIHFFRNIGTPTEASFAGSANGFDLPDADFSLSPTFADIDDDGDLDAFFGLYSGSILFFANTGSATSPAFAASSIGFGLPDVGYRSKPSFVDIDSDGDLDAFIGSDDGLTRFYRNTGTPTSAAFAASSIGFGLDFIGGYAKPIFADIDADGDLDALIGTADGTTPLFRNTGTPFQAAFAPSSSGVGLPAVDYQANPALVDIDADGDLDAFIGNHDGTILFFRNSSSIGLSSPNANGGYGPGAVITIQVAFSEAVIVDTSAGTPTLLLETGPSDRLASFSGGSGTTLLSFQYTVQNGDSSADLDVSSVAALQLNGASIRDLAGNTASLILPTPGTSTSLSGSAELVIDAVAPTLSGSTPADNATGVSESANLQLSFSEPVQAGSGTIHLWRADHQLIEAFDPGTGSGSSGGSVVFSGNTISLDPFADLASSTAYYLMIAGTAIQDATGNAYAGFSDANTLNFNTGDSISPSVRTVTSNLSDGTYGVGALISMALRFSEAVTVTLNGGLPSVVLETGSTDRSATYVSGSGTDTLTFAYSVQSGDLAADLDVVTNAALEFNGSWIKDAAGNTASPSLPAPGSAGSLGANAALVINGTSPQALIVSNATPTVNEGSSLSVRVNSDSLAPGSTLYWRFSGVGITANDLNPAILDGSLILGNDRQAVLSTAVTSDGVLEGDEQLTLTFFSDPARTRSLGGAQFTIRDQNSTGLDGATDGRDLIVGTAGDDVITGVPLGSVLNGKGSYDTLTGNGGNDIVLLGTNSAVFYDDGDPARSSAADLAAITDFNAGDRLQLKGAAADYRLANATLSGISGTLVYWRASAGAGTIDEAIGFLHGVTSTSLSLSNSSQFLYV